jgi:hypothetical protein
MALDIQKLGKPVMIGGTDPQLSYSALVVSTLDRRLVNDVGVIRVYRQGARSCATGVARLTKMNTDPPVTQDRRRSPSRW